MAYTYDARGRLAGVADAGLGAAGFSADFGYASDSDLPASAVSSSGTATVLEGARSYDTAGRLTSVAYSRPGEGVLSSHAYTLDAAGRRVRADREDGEHWIYGYNSRDEVVSASKHLADGTPITGFGSGYAYDGLGNRTSSSVGLGAAGQAVTSYSPDSLNRYSGIVHPALFAVSGRAPAEVEVSVDGQPAARQGAYWHGVVGGVDHRHHAVQARVAVEAVHPGGAGDGSDLETLLTGERFVPPLAETPHYDADGNLLSDARWLYTWDAEDRLAAVETGPAALLGGAPKVRHRHDYDSRSRRIRTRVDAWDAEAGTWASQSEERYVHDGWNVVAVIDGAGNPLRRQVWGHDLSGTPQGAGGVGGLLAAWDAATDRAWCYAYDGNGNVSAVVDLADGTKAGRYDYDAFGRLVALWGDRELAGANVYRFSTKPVEGTGLVYYGFRWYEPGTGRWLSRDPIGERGGVNLYGFVGNRTPNRTDYLGLACIKEISVKFFSSDNVPQLYHQNRDGTLDLNRPIESNGRVFSGSMCAFGDDSKIIDCWAVKSGGFLSPPGTTRVERDDDTSFPAGDYSVDTHQSPGVVTGFTVHAVPGRTGMKIHPAVYGTQGCIGVTGNFQTFESHMKNTKELAKRNTVSIRIRYSLTDGTAVPRGNRGRGMSDPEMPDDIPWYPDTEGSPGSGTNFPQ